MQKRLCVCGFILGALLVVLAVGLIAYSDHAHATLDSARRLRLAHIASAPDGCLTCHDAPVRVQDAPLALTQNRAPDAPHIDAQLRRSGVHPPAVVYTPAIDAAPVDLQGMAQRILALPHDTPGQVAQVNALTADFLIAYDALHVASVPDVLGGTLDQFARLDERLRTLEHQANPVQLAAASAPQQAPQSLAAVPLSTAPHVPAAFAGNVPELAPSEQVCGWACAAAAARIPWLVMHDVQRRGPPEAHDNLFVCKRGLLPPLPADAQSFFCIELTS